MFFTVGNFFFFLNIIYLKKIARGLLILKNMKNTKNSKKKISVELRNFSLR